MKKNPISRPSLLGRRPSWSELQSEQGQSRGNLPSGQFLPFQRSGDETTRSSQLQVSILDSPHTPVPSLKADFEKAIARQEGRPSEVQVDTNSSKKRSNESFSKRLVPINPAFPKSLSPCRFSEKENDSRAAITGLNDEFSQIKDAIRDSVVQAWSQHHSSAKKTLDSQMKELKTMSTMKKKQGYSSVKKAHSDHKELPASFNISHGLNGLIQNGDALKPKPSGKTTFSPSITRPTDESTRSRHNHLNFNSDTMHNNELSVKNKSASIQVCSKVSQLAQAKFSSHGRCFADIPVHLGIGGDVVSGQLNPQGCMTTPNSPQVTVSAKSGSKQRLCSRNFSNQRPKSESVWERLSGHQPGSKVSQLSSKPSFTKKTEAAPSTACNSKNTDRFFLNKPSTLKKTASSSFSCKSKASSKQSSSTTLCAQLRPAPDNPVGDKPDSLHEVSMNKYVFVKEGKSFHVQPKLADFRLFFEKKQSWFESDEPLLRVAQKN